jgi:hypothetical protein
VIHVSGTPHPLRKDSGTGTRRVSVQGKHRRWQHTRRNPWSPRPPVTSEALDSHLAPRFYIPHANDFPSLGSFHPRGSDRPTEEARFTRREVSHFVIAMATKSWI